MTITLTTLMAGSTSPSPTVAITNTYVAVGTGTGIAGTSSLTWNGSTLAVTGAITSTGEITAYASDKRLKTNVRPITNAIDKVVSLNGVIYNWNDIASKYGFDQTVNVAGLFAQEVEAVLPEAVKRAPFDAGPNDTSISGEDYKTIQYEKLVPLLIEAIKEQQTMITKQQQQIDQIQATMAELINK